MGYPNEMGRDVDIMGIQRGAHVDGEDVCPGYVFRVPGGELPDGTKVFGWNDTGAVYCARCGLRDTAHVVLKDLPAAAELLKEMQKKAAARALSPAGGLDGETARLRAENARFTAVVEAMIKPSPAAPPTVAKVEALNAPPPEGAPADVAEMLTRLNLPQYVDKFEEEGMEMGVLIALARGDGKDALDDALKEAGVKSVGHRLKIFAALQ